MNRLFFLPPICHRRENIRGQSAICTRHVKVKLSTHSKMLTWESSEVSQNSSNEHSNSPFLKPENNIECGEGLKSKVITGQSRQLCRKKSRENKCCVEGGILTPNNTNVSSPMQNQILFSRRSQVLLSSAPR